MRVLVVDDDSVLCHWLGVKLHSHGYACNIVNAKIIGRFSPFLMSAIAH